MELKPCPFCGGETIKLGYQWAFYRCDWCGTKGPDATKTRPIGGHDTKQMAEFLWNRRKETTNED